VPKFIIGLVGGIGSGKSRVADEFRKHGAAVISGDTLGHEALRQPEIREQVVARWGREVLDGQGEVDRRKVAKIVFANPSERRALEDMLFPWIERRIREQVGAAQADPAVRLVVLDAAIMMETGWDRVCDRIVFVDTPREARLRRLAEQRGWSTGEVEAREAAQLPLKEKAGRADVVLDNAGPPEHLARQVEALLRRWEPADGK
jgi:dephospho-CoA kinase